MKAVEIKQIGKIVYDTSENRITKKESNKQLILLFNNSKGEALSELKEKIQDEIKRLKVYEAAYKTDSEKFTKGSLQHKNFKSSEKGYNDKIAALNWVLKQMEG